MFGNGWWSCVAGPSKNRLNSLCVTYIGVKALTLNHTFDAYLFLTLDGGNCLGFLFSSPMIPDKNVFEQDSFRRGTPLPLRQGRPHEE